MAEPVFDPTYDPLRDYDLAVVTKLGASVQSPAEEKPYYAIAVAGFPEVRVHVGLPEDWYKNHALPAIHIRRARMVPAPSRMLPNFRGKERSTNPATPNTWNIQSIPSQPVNIVYEIQVATAAEVHMNKLVGWLMLAMPTSHWGTYLTVDGQNMNYEATGSRDLTDYTSKDGRQFIQQFDYTVEGWFIPSLACEKVEEILTVDIGLETHKSGAPLHREPPVLASAADEVRHIVLTDD